MEKLISVIVPVYNSEQYLEECIDSILKQSFEEIEVILVDDGSIDRSGLICDRYAAADERVRVFHQENKGPIEARRKGLLESRCSYVTYVDGDDFLERDAYVRAILAMQDQVDLVIFGMTRYYSSFYKKNEDSDFCEGRYNKTEIEEIIWPGMIWNKEKERFGVDPSLCNKIMRRDLALSCFQMMPKLRFHYGEDMAIVYPALKEARSVEVIRHSYYNHRQRERSNVPEYFRDDAYFDKLYMLYQYLTRRFGENRVFQEQIEYFYMHAVNLRRQIYGDRAEPVKYLFPFDKVSKKDKIVLYGAGAVGQAYRKQLEKIPYSTVVLWVDKNFKQYQNGTVSSLEEMREATYDKVVLAIENCQVREDVRSDLIHMGVEQEKIVT